MFTDITHKDSQWVNADPKHSTYLASALIVRGRLDMLDIRRNIDRLSKSLRFPEWNTDGWKIGVCSVPPLNQVLNSI
jgi:tubulin epsilon